MTKKILMMTLVVFMLCIALLSGCSGIEEPKPPGADGKPPVVSPPTLPGEGESKPDAPPSDGGENPPEELPPEDTQPPKPQPPQKQYDKMMVSNVSGLNVRSGAGSSYTVVGSINKGDALPYLGSSGSWYKTSYKGKTAYISASSISFFDVQKEDVVRETIIEVGKTVMGFPYIYGAQRLHFGNGVLNTKFNATIFDCSSLTQYVYYKAAGILLDTTSRSQSVQGKNTADLKRGDLMFFTNESRVNLSGLERIGHVGIYFGNNYILHTASDYAVIEPISDKRWSYFITARSFL